MPINTKIIIFDPLIRLNLTNNTIILDETSTKITMYEIKKDSKANFEILIESLWIKNNDYGINWQIKKIIIV